ncbi:ferrous iron transport protein A [Rhodopirellula baltica]|nr:ferrous iron transport protein A [Rhodopirellula baltica]
MERDLGVWSVGFRSTLLTWSFAAAKLLRLILNFYVRDLWDPTAMASVQTSISVLAGARKGFYQCVDVDASGQNAIRLKRLGICAGRVLELVGQGDPMVLQLGNSRIGLSRQLANFVSIAPAEALLPGPVAQDALCS